jgi:hypothetical protein
LKSTMVFAGANSAKHVCSPVRQDACTERPRPHSFC